MAARVSTQVLRRDAMRWTFVALVLRAAWLVVAARRPIGLHDPGIYLGYGKGLVETGEYLNLMRSAKTAYFPVGYPFFVSVVMRVGVWTHLWDFGHLPQQIANVFVGVAAVPLTYWTATRVVSRRAAGIAAAIVALMPSQILYSTAVLSEVLFQLVLLAGVAVLLNAPRRGDASGAPAGWWVLGGGALLGVAVMVRGVALVIPAAVFVALLLGTLGWRVALRTTVVVVIGLTVVAAPWGIRNVAVFDRWVGLSTNVGDDFCIGNAPGASGAFELQQACFTDANADMNTPAAEAARSDEAMQVGIDGIKSDFGRLPRLTANKAWALMSRDWDGMWVAESYGEDRFLPEWARTAMVWGANLSWGLLVVAAAVGSVLLLRQRRWAPALLVMVPASLLALPLVFFGEPRFHFPAMPFLAIAAATAVAALGEWRRGRDDLDS